MASRRSAMGAAIAGILLSSTAVGADPVRTILERATLAPTPPQDAAMGIVMIGEGEEIGWHRHPGIEIGIVTVGQIIFSVKGQPDRTIAAGTSFQAPRGVAHRARAADGAAQIVATWITDRGAPIATPADRTGG